jgi:ATP-dependent DNA ligase
MPQRATRSKVGAREAHGQARRMSHFVPLDTRPMEAKLVDELPDGPGWQFEPKWDGFRCLAFCNAETIELRGKSGKPLGRYFPEMVEQLRSLGLRQTVLDGELAIPVGESLSFDALQMRLHPAESRIRKLSHETPAIFIIFDLLATGESGSLLQVPLRERRAALEELFAPINAALLLRLSPYTRRRSEAAKWLARAGGALDGVVAKPLNGVYAPGERAMLKVKRLRTADCVIGGFRYENGAREVGSLLLGLYNDEACSTTLASPQRSRDWSGLRSRSAWRRWSSRPASRAQRQVAQAAGVRSGRASGSRCGPSSSSRFATIT